jgi:hypothetical protein
MTEITSIIVFILVIVLCCWSLKMPKEKKICCKNCGTKNLTFEELLFTIEGYVRCPDCCSSEVEYTDGEPILKNPFNSRNK